jgi:hypothetical protein
MVNSMGKESKFNPEALKSVCDSIISNSNKELFAKSKEQLEEYWHFKWDDTLGLIYNTYKFFNMLGLYKSFVRRWEEHHNGCCCVVERVRDKYLIPKIAEFYLDMKNHNIKEGK